MDNSIFEWEPNKSVGRINFGETVTGHVESGFLNHCDDPMDDDGLGCFAHGENEDPAVYLDEETEVIEHIICFEALIHCGQNLIGITINRAIEILGQEPDVSGDKVLEDDDEFTVEFDSLGLILWVREKDSKIMSAGVSSALDSENMR